MQALQVVTKHRVNPSKLLLLKLHFDNRANRLNKSKRELYHALMRTHYPVQHGPRVSRTKPSAPKIILPNVELQVNTEMSTLYN